MLTPPNPRLWSNPPPQIRDDRDAITAWNTVAVALGWALRDRVHPDTDRVFACLSSMAGEDYNGSKDQVMKIASDLTDQFLHHKASLYSGDASPVEVWRAIADALRSDGIIT